MTTNTAGGDAVNVAPEPMEGHGAYDRNSRVQGSSLSSILPLLEQAAEVVPVDFAAPLVVADYGCAGGRNSLEPMRVAVRALRHRAGAGRPICVVHNDLPANDFAALFDLLANDPGSYLHGDPHVYPSAVGRSFFQSVVPPDSVTLGWTAWSVQWLSRMPMTIPDQVQVAFSRDAAARAAYARQAAQDWAAFLSARDGEMRAGGRLVVLAMASADIGGFGYRISVESIYGALQDLCANGFLDATEVERMAIPTYGRTRAEFLAPFEASGRFGNLILETIELFTDHDRIWAESGEGRDASLFATRWAKFSRASVFPTLASALREPADAVRRGAFFDRMEAAMTRRLAASPERSLIPLAKLIVSKVPA
jgi:hypothetical protein